jgi:hypothetical protein
MGFELGPGLLRRAPRGWLAGRAFPLRHSVYSYDGGPEHGESVIDTSAGLRVLWRVEVPGREPYELDEDRSAPMWLHSSSLGSGNRWYKVRVRPQYGLMGDLGVPVFVNPKHPSEIWIDWDAAYKEHVPAWEREARVRREVGRRKGGIDGALERIGHPLTGKLRPEDEKHVQQKIERDAARERELAAKYAPPPPDPAVAAESTELMRRMDELTRIHTSGVKTVATVVAREDTDRTFGGVPVIVLTFDVDGRRIVFEHTFGPRHAKHYKVGKQVEVWVDRDDPDAICPGR